MNPYANPQAYRQASVLTATPAQLVVMLYDGVGRFLRQADVAFGEGAWQHAHDRLGRAEAIINELLATLDMDQGLVSERLQSIYVFSKRQLAEARIERKPDNIRTVIRLFASLREAWAQIAGGSVRTPELHRRRDAALAALPPGLPSPDDRPLLEHALAVQMQVTAHLERARDEVRNELQRLSHRRQAARGYAAAAGA